MPIRPHGRGWEVRVQHAGGRTSRTFRNYRDAQEYERRLKQQVADHRVGRAPRHSLEEAVERWLYGEAKALRSHRNLENKVRALLPFIQGKTLEQVAEAAEEVIKAGAGLKPATVNRRLAILRRVARLAYRKWQWLEHDQAGRIQLLPGEEARDVQATPQQVDKLLAAAEPRTRRAIVWAALTGLRQGELRRTRSRTKTTTPRLVPRAPGLRAQDFPYELTDREVTTAFRAARERAGMPWLQFRDLRRTCGSWIVQRTRSLKAAQDLLGHTSIAITAKHYAHLLDEHLVDAVRTLPRLAGLARGRRRKLKAA
jgi:integrase